VIPEAAIEAAAAEIERRMFGPVKLGDLVRGALEAAAPHMLADAWDEGSIAGWVESGLPHSWSAENSLRSSNPYR
jgi:hypothetical protein